VKLSLKGFKTPQSALINILCKHKATLKDIKLMDMRLRTDEHDDDPSDNWDNKSWIPIFKTIREFGEAHAIQTRRSLHQPRRQPSRDMEDSGDRMLQEWQTSYRLSQGKRGVVHGAWW
jgi:hypothetical protein